MRYLTGMLKTNPVVSVSAASIGVGGSVLNGTLAFNGNADCSIYFCWSTNDCGTTFNAWPNIVSLGTTNSGQAISTPITTVTEGLTYWYRAYAANSAGAAWSGPTSFVQSAGDFATNYTENATNFTAYVFTNNGNLLKQKKGIFLVFYLDKFYIYNFFHKILYNDLCDYLYYTRFT